MCAMKYSKLWAQIASKSFSSAHGFLVAKEPGAWNETSAIIDSVFLAFSMREYLQMGSNVSFNSVLTRVAKATVAIIEMSSAPFFSRVPAVHTLRGARAEVLGSTTSAWECRGVDGATRTRADWCPVNCSIRPTVVAPEAAASSDGCRLLEIHRANTSRGPVRGSQAARPHLGSDNAAMITGPDQRKVEWRGSVCRTLYSRGSVVEMAIGEGRVVEFDRRSGENGSVAGLENKGEEERASSARSAERASDDDHEERSSNNPVPARGRGILMGTTTLSSTVSFPSKCLCYSDASTTSFQLSDQRRICNNPNYTATMANPVKGG
ncbi:hypothetical protein DFH09DRAFT_1075934 [Mycena vulgaris]|nr:hypothetical protein DFH09DRAFT_1075934 [Mycena vulgaris]